MDNPEFHRDLLANLGPFAGLLEQCPLEEFLEGLTEIDEGNREYVCKYWRKGFLGIHKGQPFHPRLKTAWAKYLRALAACKPQAAELCEAAEEAMLAIGPKESKQSIIIPPGR